MPRTYWLLVRNWKYIVQYDTHYSTSSSKQPLSILLTSFDKTAADFLTTNQPVNNESSTVICVLNVAKCIWFAAFNNTQHINICISDLSTARWCQRRFVFPSLRLPTNRWRGLLVSILRSASPFFASRFIWRCVTLANFFAFFAICQTATVSTSALVLNIHINYQLRCPLAWEFIVREERISSIDIPGWWQEGNPPIQKFCTNYQSGLKDQLAKQVHSEDDH